MDVDACREYIELVRCLNFTEAAERLHMTQSALSKHLAGLESEMGAKLLVRDRHECRLSEAGRVLYEAAVQIVSEYDGAAARIAELEREPPVRVDGILYDPTIASIISLSTILLDEAPHPPLVFDHRENASLLGLLTSGQIDLILGHEGEEDLRENDLAVTPLLSNRFVAVVDRSDPLAGLESLRAEDLRDSTLIQFIDTYAAHGWRSIAEYLGRHGVSVRRRTVLGSPTSYQSTPLEGAVLIQANNVRNLKFLNEAGRYAVVPFADDDALFHIDCIYHRADSERLSFIVDTLVEARDMVVRHNAAKRGA